MIKANARLDKISSTRASTEHGALCVPRELVIRPARRHRYQDRSKCIRPRSKVGVMRLVHIADSNINLAIPWRRGLRALIIKTCLDMGGIGRVHPPGSRVISSVCALVPSGRYLGINVCGPPSGTAAPLTKVRNYEFGEQNRDSKIGEEA
ncbi:hypothetical protein LY78DRAFT_85622 [Colletotrichum sublineola]|nr:hypothetical protein LY78DRAFT_85622 [Colletotrichum sublineola]